MHGLKQMKQMIEIEGGKSQIMYLMSPKYEWFEGGNHKLKPEVQGDTDIDTGVLGRGSFLGISTNG